MSLLTSASGIYSFVAHKVFVSYHHANDQEWRNKFETMCLNTKIIISKSVQIGDIDPNLSTETIRNKIRDEYLRDSTVTIVLIGTETWKRKHVDWEIGSSIHDTRLNPRSGLIGILLPTHKNYNENTYTPSIIPPRLYYNEKSGFAKIYSWSDNIDFLQKIIHEAFERRKKGIIDDSYPSFVNKKSGDGWTV